MQDMSCIKAVHVQYEDMMFVNKAQIGEAIALPLYAKNTTGLPPQAVGDVIMIPHMGIVISIPVILMSYNLCNVVFRGIFVQQSFCGCNLYKICCTWQENFSKKIQVHN